MITINSDLIRGHIDTIILKVLSEGDRYGYDIIKEIDAKSKGLYKLKTPTLYSCLKRLEVQGLVVARWGPKASGGRRKYYTLTENGKLYFDKNQEEWEFSRTIIDRLISERDYDLTNSLPIAEDEFLEEADSEFTETVLIEEIDDKSSDTEAIENLEQEPVSLSIEADKPVTESVVYPDYDEIVYDEFYQEDIERAPEQLQFETAEVSETIDEESAFNALFYSALSTARSYADNAAKQTAPVTFANDNAIEPELDYLENDDDVDYDAIDVIEASGQTETAAAIDNTPPPAFIEKLLNKSFGEQPASSVMQQPYYDPEAEQDNNKYRRPSITEEAVKSAFETPGGYLHPDYTAERKPSRQSINEDMYSGYFNEGSKPDYRAALADVFTPDPEFLATDVHPTEIFQNAVKNENRYIDGYVIKQHNSSSNKDYKNQYYFYDNRLAFAYSRTMGILLLSISIISLAAFMLLLDSFDAIDIAFIIGSILVSLLYPIVGFIIYKLDPMHRKRLDFDFVGTLFYKFLVFVICILLIITVNIVFFNVDIHALHKNLVTLLLPTAMALVIPFSTFIYSALYKSKKYSVE